MLATDVRTVDVVVAVVVASHSAAMALPLRQLLPDGSKLGGQRQYPRFQRVLGALLLLLLGLATQHVS